MGLFSRSKPQDTNALAAALDRGSFDDFLSVYEPEHVHYDGYPHASLLTMALANKNLEARVAISHRLLDDGADVTQHRPLHVLLGQVEHGFTAEAELLQRMLDLGADVNEVSPRTGTPLETVVDLFKFSDDTLQPFYDVLLARPDLDLLAPGHGGRPVLVNLRKAYARRGALVERAEALLTARGVPLPEPER